MKIALVAPLIAAAMATTTAFGEAAPTIGLGPMERVKIDVLAQMMSDASGRPFAISGGLDNEFSVLVPDGDPVALSPDEIYTFGLSILASAGLSVVDDGHTCRIVSLPEGGGLAVGAPGGNPEGQTDSVQAVSPAPHGLMTRVFRLKNATADEVRRVLEGGSGRKSWITMLESANLIVVTDTAPTLERVAALVAELDKPGLARTTEIVNLKFADA
ncbi:MAG: hypothetical protein IKO40_06270, partial [Kiritimatiellae bacterium]|nr:hypothetical protein [Kiritimatiellia bacterium]